MTQTEKFELKTSNPVWIICPYPTVTLGLAKMMEEEVQVYNGQRLPTEKPPSSIIFYPDEENVVSRVRSLQALAPDALILVLGLCVDPRLARVALLAGACGFIHLGMQPAQIIHALSEASRDKIVMPRELLEAFLVEIESQEDPVILSPSQREILEEILQLAAETISQNDIVMPRELLEAFLVEVAMA